MPSPVRALSLGQGSWNEDHGIPKFQGRQMTPGTIGISCPADHWTNLLYILELIEISWPA